LHLEVFSQDKNMTRKLVLGKALNVTKCCEEHIAVDGRASGNKKQGNFVLKPCKTSTVENAL
jgi:hypothetical protein